MTGSISVQCFPYRRGLVQESSKTFHFFPRYFLRRRRIYISKYLYCKVVSKCFKLCSLRCFQHCESENPAQSRPCCASAANHRSLLPIDLLLESGPRQRVFQLESHRPAAV